MNISSTSVSKLSPGDNTSGAQAKKGFDLKTEDFIKMMITQLQNQDPTAPAKNEELLAQMSQIGQLESSNKLQTSLAAITSQNSLSAAGSMIGKMVTGKDTNGEDLEGIVTSVKVVDGKVGLELDNGKQMSMSSVLGITSTNPIAKAA